MSVTEGMDEFEQTVSSGSKRSRSRTSEVWNDFEISIQCNALVGRSRAQPMGGVS